MKTYDIKTMEDSVETVGNYQPTAPSNSSLEPTHRVVLVGASNLTRAVHIITKTAQDLWGDSGDFLIAMGHGRSYGQPSTVMVRRLPGILQSGLWDALERRPELPTHALLTDIGNDILYEVPIEKIAGWVETMLQRLEKHQAQTVITLLPTENVGRILPWQYFVVRSFFFPGCRLPLKEVGDRAVVLNGRLRELAKKYNVKVIEQNPEWYGFDPIHLKTQLWAKVYQDVLSCYDEACDRDLSVGSFIRWLSLRTCFPERHWLCGIAGRGAQPARITPEGSRFSFF
ncbi:SGNH/GDSL hydrolase family protein [Planctomycetales bacterium 10988]|nr:SGNH/GDSL hydrolase family protein [Planctomycetales bacterium 10988]